MALEERCQPNFGSHSVGGQGDNDRSRKEPVRNGGGHSEKPGFSREPRRGSEVRASRRVGMQGRDEVRGNDPVHVSSRENPQLSLFPTGGGKLRFQD